MVSLRSVDDSTLDEVDEVDAVGPPLPMGRRVHLEGRGTTFVREVDGPPDASTVVLLHGWIASAGLNWFTAFEPLGARYRVVAPDLRGHGRGIRSRRRFRLADCADDVAALLRELDTGPVVVVGYSLGGPVAQLLWRRHPDLVDGLVLCATSDRLMPGVREAMIFSSMMAVAAGTTRLGEAVSRVPIRAVRRRLPTAWRAEYSRPSNLRRWAAAEMRRHSPRAVIEAGQAMGTYNARRWLRHVDVPAAVVVTAQDRAVPPLVQLRMALAIPGASIHRVDDGHVACARDEYVGVLIDAIDDVRGRGSIA